MRLREICVGVPCEGDDGGVVRAEDAEIVVPLATRVVAPYVIEGAQQPGNADAFGIRPVTKLDFVLLVVYLFFESRRCLFSISSNPL
jgi:hypothetical protein